MQQRTRRKPQPLNTHEAARLAHVRMLGSALEFGRVVDTLAEEVFKPYLAVGLYRVDRGRLYVVIKMNRENLAPYSFLTMEPAVQIYLRKVDDFATSYVHV